MSPTAVFPSFNDRPSLFALGATDRPGCLWLGHPAETQIEGADQRHSATPTPSALLPWLILLRSASLPQDDALLCTSSRLKDLKRVKREWKFSETYGFCVNSPQRTGSVYVLMRHRDSLLLLSVSVCVYQSLVYSGKVALSRARPLGPHSVPCSNKLTWKQATWGREAAPNFSPNP